MRRVELCDWRGNILVLLYLCADTLHIPHVVSVLSTPNLRPRYCGRHPTHFAGTAVRPLCRTALRVPSRIQLHLMRTLAYKAGTYSSHVV